MQLASVVVLILIISYKLYLKINSCRHQGHTLTCRNNSSKRPLHFHVYDVLIVLLMFPPSTT
jgi:hypothetical protein